MDSVFIFLLMTGLTGLFGLFYLHHFPAWRAIADLY